MPEPKGPLAALARDSRELRRKLDKLSDMLDELAEELSALDDKITDAAKAGGADAPKEKPGFLDRPL